MDRREFGDRDRRDCRAVRVAVAGRARPKRPAISADSATVGRRAAGACESRWKPPANGASARPGAGRRTRRTSDAAEKKLHAMVGEHEQMERRRDRPRGADISPAAGRIAKRAGSARFAAAKQETRRGTRAGDRTIAIGAKPRIATSTRVACRELRAEHDRDWESLAERWRAGLGRVERGLGPDARRVRAVVSGLECDGIRQLAEARRRRRRPSVRRAVARFVAGQERHAAGRAAAAGGNDDATAGADDARRASGAADHGRRGGPPRGDRRAATGDAADAHRDAAGQGAVHDSRSRSGWARTSRRSCTWPISTSS